MLNLVYIASPSYSGSTLLTFLLNAHPAIGTIGELKWGEIDLETYQCSCGELLRECAFWKKVQTFVEDSGLPFDLNRPATDFRCRGHWAADRVARARIRNEFFEKVRDLLILLLPSCRRSWPMIAAVNRAVIEAALELQNAVCFLDGSKEPVRFKHFMDTGIFDLRLIQLVRDARGVTNSSIKNESVRAEVGAVEWVRTHQQIERLAVRLGSDRHLRVRYEDICGDPKTTVRRICEFIGVREMPNTTHLQPKEHHILGNRMRLKRNMNITLDEKWRTMLSPNNLDVIDRIAGKLNRTYGYS